MPDRITVPRWYFLHLLALCLLALSATAPSADAQVSAYGVVGVNSYGFSYRGNSPSSYYDTAGFGGGAFYNFPIRSRVTVGIDGRVFYGPGSYGGTTADAALRIGFVPTVNRLRPYLAIGGGMVTSVLTPGYEPARVTNGALELLGGLDIRMTDSVDIRAVEWGAAAGYSSTGIASEVGFLDAGVVYHFRPNVTRN
jgi:opacity protein-like surface antigen